MTELITRQLRQPLRYSAGVLLAGMTVEYNLPSGYWTTVTVGRTSVQVRSLQLVRSLAHAPCPELDENEYRTGSLTHWYVYCVRADPGKHPERMCAGDQRLCCWRSIREAAKKRQAVT